MVKVIYFIETEHPTTTELADIATLDGRGDDVLVRTRLGRTLFGDNIEPSDEVAGLVPAAYFSVTRAGDVTSTDDATAEPSLSRMYKTPPPRPNEAWEGNGAFGGVGGDSWADAPNGLVAHILVTLGNSATVGRGSATGQTFSATALEWTQAETLSPAGTAYGTGANIDAADTNATASDYSPVVAYVDTYIANNPGIDAVIVVPEAEGSSALDTQWAVPSGAKTLTATSRLAAAYAAAVAAGYTVPRTVVSYMSLGSDLSATINGTQFNDTVARWKAFIDYWEGQAPTDEFYFVVNTGQTQAWLTANPDVDYDTLMQHRRALPYTRGNIGVVDLPLYPITLLGDALHPDTSSNEVYVGPAMATAASAAVAADGRTANEFEGLSFFADMLVSYAGAVPGYDPVSGANPVTNELTNTPYTIFDNISGKDVVGLVPTGTRLFTVPLGTTGASDFTIMWGGWVSAFNASFGTFQNTVANVRMYYSNGNGWRFGTTGTAGTVTNTVPVDTLFSLAMVYDSAANTAELFINGVSSGSGAAAATGVGGDMCIGAQNTTPIGVLPGATVHVGVVNRKLTAAECLEHYTTLTT